MAVLATKLGDRFVAGLVLHMGEVNLPFGDKIYALAASALWDHARLTTSQTVTPHDLECDGHRCYKAARSRLEVRDG